MSKVTKRELLKRIEALEEWSKGADDMLTELNHALPDPEYDAKCEAAAADVEASLDRHRERLGLDRPKLKQLDQSVFDGLDEKWQWAAVDKNGEANLYTHRMTTDSTEFTFCKIFDFDYELIGTGYNATNWQDSLIERESKELTGSDLCHEMLKRGDKAVMCKINESNNMTIIVGCKESRLGGWVFHSHRHSNHYIVTPINNQGEPLTQSDVGL